MTRLRTEMIRQMQLQRLSESTQKSYIRMMQQLAGFYNQSPDQLTPRQLQDYLLHLSHERKLAWSTCNIASCAMEVFYTKVLKWDPLKLELPPRTRPKTLPEILSQEEVARLLIAPPNLKHRTLLMTIYATGLRVGEAVGLQITDIQSDRRMIHVKQGKGRRDRYTILSDDLLKRLRTYWRAYQPGLWLFPGQDPTRRMARRTAQKIYDKAKRLGGITRGRGIHTLRHCFATHLMEAGVSVRLIQVLLGHRSLKTTEMYLRVMNRHLQSVKSPLDLLSLPEDPTKS